MQKSIAYAMAAIAISITLSACQKQSDTAEKGPAERVGAQVDAATAKAAEGLNKAGEKAGQALQSGGQKAGEAIQQGGEKLEGAAKDAQKKE